MSNPPRITVAIPAYNRPEEIGPLLSSILSQDYEDFDVLVVEDHSPRRAEIESVVLDKARAFPKRSVTFVSNPKNLGFDGNIRRVIELSKGSFTFFMGDDDILRPGALARVGAAIEKHPELGVILRAYEQVHLKTGEQLQVFRYFPEDRFFTRGPDAVRTFFRRSVSIAGYTVHTETARQASTSRFDGTLLYQLHLSAQVLMKRDGYFIRDILTAMRKNDEQRHFFGSAESEKSLFAPGALTPEHSLNFMRGMFNIARAEEEMLGVPLFEDIAKDIGNYSYPFLKLHAHSVRTFLPYVRELAGMGLARNPLFWTYSAALAALPVPVLDKLIVSLKKRLPATPRFGKLYEGVRS